MGYRLYLLKPVLVSPPGSDPQVPEASGQGPTEGGEGQHGPGRPQEQDQLRLRPAQRHLCRRHIHPAAEQGQGNIGGLYFINED